MMGGVSRFLAVLLVAWPVAAAQPTLASEVQPVEDRGLLDQTWQMPAKVWVLRLGAGIYQADGNRNLPDQRVELVPDLGWRLGLTDHLEYGFPAFLSARLRPAEWAQTLASVGVIGVGWSTWGDVEVTGELQLIQVVRLGRRHELALRLIWRPYLASESDFADGGGALTLAWLPIPDLLLCLGLGYEANANPSRPTAPGPSVQHLLFFGSAAGRGLAPLPVLRVRIGGSWSAYAAVRVGYAYGRDPGTVAHATAGLFWEH